MKPGQIALLASLCALEDEEDFRRKLQADKPEHKVGFAFMTGTADEIKISSNAASSAVLLNIRLLRVRSLPFLRYARPAIRR